MNVADNLANKWPCALLKASVYRRYLDYGVFDALRDMKAMMATQIQRKDMADNIRGTAKQRNAFD